MEPTSPLQCFSYGSWETEASNILLRRAARGFFGMSHQGKGTQAAPVSQPAVSPRHCWVPSLGSPLPALGR